MKMKVFAAGIAAFSAVAASVASAAPVTFEFISTVKSTSIAGTSIGDAVEFKIFADNGSSGVFGQSWGNSDYLGASASIGGIAYTAVFDVAVSSFSATTDALGKVTGFYLSDFNGNSDSLGGTPSFILNGYRNNLFTVGYVDAEALTTPENFSVSLDVSAVPVPASLPLLAFGLGGLGYMARRKRKAV